MKVINSKTILVFDIGSGRTRASKLSITCTSGEIAILNSAKKLISYQQFVSDAKDAHISREVMQIGLDSIKTLQLELDVSCEKIKCLGIATAWARNAKNTDEYTKLLKAHNIHIHTIDQNTEARIGMQAAESTLSVNTPPTPIFFDIGGGSYQLSYRDHNSQVHYIVGAYGGANFKHDLQNFLKSKNFENFHDRFLSPDEIKAAAEFVEENVSKVIRNAVIDKNFPLATDTIYGFGGTIVLERFVSNSDSISKTALSELVNDLANSNFMDAIAKYQSSAAEITSSPEYLMILVSGILKGLNSDTLTFIHPENAIAIATELHGSYIGECAGDAGEL
jgi:exopolyphosphatase/guanosine-5'-triphosphate,3'-diphosphate pyrophosphatase